MKEGACTAFLSELGNDCNFPDFYAELNNASLDIFVSLGTGNNDFFLVSAVIHMATQKLKLPDPVFMKNMSDKMVVVFRLN